MITLDLGQSYPEFIKDVEDIISELDADQDFPVYLNLLNKDVYKNPSYINNQYLKLHSFSKEGIAEAVFKCSEKLIEGKIDGSIPFHIMTDEEFQNTIFTSISFNSDCITYLGSVAYTDRFPEDLLIKLFCQLTKYNQNNMLSIFNQDTINKIESEFKNISMSDKFKLYKEQIDINKYIGIFLNFIAIFIQVFINQNTSMFTILNVIAIIYLAVKLYPEFEKVKMKSSIFILNGISPFNKKA